MEYFKPYEGDKPYIFISYAHADSPAVMEIVNRLHDRGYRIWYDEGIEVGSEWPECIASHLSGAHLVMAFISNSYIRSDNCRREMHYALTKRIKTINIFLEDTQMTPGMEMQIGSIFALMKQYMSEESFYEKLYNAPLLNSEPFSDVVKPASAPLTPAKAEDTPQAPAKTEVTPQAPAKKKKRREKKPKEAKEAKEPKEPKPAGAKKLKRWIIGGVCLLLLAAVITLAIVGHFTGLSQRLLSAMHAEKVNPLPMNTKAEFSEPAFEAAAREYSGIKSGELLVSDLAGLRELYIVGDKVYFDAPTAVSNSQGSIESLDDLAYFTGLRTLWLVNQPVRTLSSLPASNLEYLNISGCRVTSLEGIGRLPKLRELCADGCPIAELGDIERCLKLRSIRLVGSNILDYAPLKSLIRLTEFATSNSTLDDLHPVFSIGALSHVELYDCDLRGRFFYAFDRERTMASLSLINCELSSTTNLEDFSGLTKLTLISSGAELDWVRLRALSDLREVTVDANCYEAISAALEGSKAVINLIETTPEIA